MEVFNNLKKKLGVFARDVDGTIDKAAEGKSAERGRAGPGAKEKLKSVILDRELVIDEGSLEKPLWDLEIALLESDVAMPAAEEILKSLKEELIGERRKFTAKTHKIAEEALRNALLKVVSSGQFDFDTFIRDAAKPVKILFVGVNGTGKTTCIAKVAYRLRERGHSVVLASGDTFRAGAEEQIDAHAERLGVKLIKHQQGADPAAVIYDAVQHANARKLDVVLADTAGRFHTSVNLMEQLKKICRVNKPDLIIFVDEAIAGNDAVERAKQFNEAIGIGGSILTKIDADAKGGAAISIAHVTGKPILFVGTGQEYGDLEPFKPEWLVEKLIG